LKVEIEALKAELAKGRVKAEEKEKILFAEVEKC